MHNLWGNGAASLLHLLNEVHGAHVGEDFHRFERDRRGPGGPAWPAVLTRLTGIEAALLQDVSWWGPMMGERLHRWSAEQRAVSQDRCMAA